MHSYQQCMSHNAVATNNMTSDSLTAYFQEQCSYCFFKERPSCYLVTNNSTCTYNSDALTCLYSLCYTLVVTNKYVTFLNYLFSMAVWYHLGLFNLAVVT